MASRMFFNGRQYTTPATVSQVDDAEMAPRNPATGNNLAIVGLADAGKPGVPIRLQDPREAERVLMGGELLMAARKAFGPSAQTGGPRTVTVVRVGQATQSTLTLKDSADNDAIVLTSEIYGIPANAIRVKVEAGTLRGKKVTTQLGNRYYTADNIARDVFTVQYTGAETTATMTVAPDSVTLTAGEGSPVVLSLDDFPTVQQLVDRINTQAGFAATVTPGSELAKAKRALDGLTAANVKAGAVTVTANLQAVIDWFNSNAEGFVHATRPATASLPPANVPFTFLSGATNPPVTTGDWADAIAALQTVDVQWCVPLSDNPAVHAAMDAHVVFMSTAAGKERRAWVGPGLGATKEDAITAAALIGSDRTGLVWPGHYDVNERGERTLVPSYMTAVLVAAAFAGVNPGVALTNKTIRVSGLEVEPRNPSDTDELIAGGVCCIERTDNGYKVVRSISTWLANDNYNRVEMSCGAATDFVVRSVRERLDVLRGEPASPRSLQRAAAIADSALRALAIPAPAGPGVIVGDANSPAYTTPVASLEGDIINVSFQCSPVIPLNFVQLGVALRPYSGTTAISS